MSESLKNGEKMLIEVTIDTQWKGERTIDNSMVNDSKISDVQLIKYKVSRVLP